MPIGSRLGSYEILAAIGAGGMGEVYRARDAKLGRDVAIKVLPASFARDAERMARFEREAKVLASLNHPNIAAIYGFEDSSGVHALVMELVEGPTLADRIAAGPIPADEALRVARQIADALEYAHERGIVHRDLKPANIKISRDDAVKILDFGLAKAVEGDASSMDMANSPTLTHMATQAGVLLGTAAYMSPEQAKAKPVDRRADIWAFGCVLYEMLTGKRPFDGETVTDTLAAVIRADPDWSLLPPGTPPRVRVLLQRCLQKDPKQRLRDIGDARISLDEVLSGTSDPASVAAATTTRPPFWRRALPWSVAAALAIVAAVLAWAYQRAVHAPAPPANPIRFQIPITAPLAQGGGRFAISPDGRQLAFAATGSDGASRLWVRPLNSLEARPLPGTEASTFPPFFWSPDSRNIAFGADGKLKTVDVAGGTVETLCGAPGLVIGGSWNRDGTIIFGSFPGGIMKVSASGGTATPVTTLDPSRQEIYHGMPFFLPDGRHFIYQRLSSRAGNSGGYIGSIDTKPGEQDLTPLIVGDSSAGYAPSSEPDVGQLLFMRNGLLMAQPFDARMRKLSGAPVAVAENVGAFQGDGFFSVSANGILVYRTADASTALLQLTWFNGQGKALGTAGEPGVYGQPALSPDGTEAAYVQFRVGGQSDVWLLDLARGTSTRLTFSSDAEDPIWSADGKRVIFTSSPNGTSNLYEKLANGASGEELLLKSTEDKGPTDVSRDGRYLLYNSIDPKTGMDIWVLPLQGDRKPFPFLSTDFNEGDAHFSPDGRWVAYASGESGYGEIYVRPFSPDSNAADASGAGAKWQVSYGGGDAPRWSANGKELYYVTPDSKVMRVDVTTSPTFQAGTPKLLFQAQDANDANGNYTIDGKKFVFLVPAEQTGQARSAFNVVLNWQALLKQSQ